MWYLYIWMIIIEADYHDSPKNPRPDVSTNSPILICWDLLSFLQGPAQAQTWWSYPSGDTPATWTWKFPLKRDLSFGWFPLFFNQIQHPWFRSSKGNISTIIVIVVWDTTCRHAEITFNDKGSGRPSIHLKGYMPHMCWTHSGFIGLILHLEVVTTNPIWPWKHIPLMSCPTWSFSIDTCLQQNFQRSWGIGIRISIARRTESTISMYHHFEWW